MKKLFKKITNSVKSFATRVKTAAVNFMSSVFAFNRRAVCGNAGEGYALYTEMAHTPHGELSGAGKVDEDIV